MKKLVTSALLVCMVANVAYVCAGDSAAAPAPVNPAVAAAPATPATSATAAQTGVLNWIKTNKGKSALLLLGTALVGYFVYKVYEAAQEADDEEAVKAFEARLEREYAEQLRCYETQA